MAELSLRNSNGSRTRFPLAKDVVTIGRSRDADISIGDAGLSRGHARVERRADGYYLVDLGSRNGTLLNGERLTEARRLEAGDEIRLGRQVLAFCWDEPRDAEEESDEEPLAVEAFPVLDLADLSTREDLGPELAERRRSRLALLARVAEALPVHLPLPELFDSILRQLFEAVPAERGAILLLEGDPPRERLVASRAQAGPELVGLSRAIVRRVVEGRVALLLPRVMDDPELRTRDSVAGLGIHSAVCVPLWLSPEAGRTQVIGLFYLDSFQASHAFGEEDLALLTGIANLAAARIENMRLLRESREKQRIEEELRQAGSLQRELMPAGGLEVPGYALAASYRPCRSVGGDYFDFLRDGEDLLLALADVAGKGTGAALLAALVRAGVRTHWLGRPPDAVTAEVNRSLCHSVPDNRFATLFLGRLATSAGRLSYVNSGHRPPLLLRRDGEVVALTEGGLPLGLFDHSAYAVGVADIGAGETLVVYSDGVTEALDPGGAEFGEQRLIALLRGQATAEVGQLAETILAAVERFDGSAHPSDDRTLIVLRRL